MKVPTQDGKKIDMQIERREFNTTWLRIDKFLIGFSESQLRDVDLFVTRVSVIAGIEFATPDDEDWKDVLVDLAVEFKAAQRLAVVAAPRKLRAVVRAVETDFEEEEEDHGKLGA